MNNFIPSVLDCFIVCSSDASIMINRVYIFLPAGTFNIIIDLHVKMYMNLCTGLITLFAFTGGDHTISYPILQAVAEK